MSLERYNHCKKIEKEKILDQDNNNNNEGHIILPQTEQLWNIFNVDKVPMPKTDADQFFVGFSMEYEFGYKKKGTCGFIGKYSPSSDGATGTAFEEYWVS
jgi:hypothetical protein